jgi:hypothetical protein
MSRYICISEEYYGSEGVAIFKLKIPAKKKKIQIKNKKIITDT